MEIFACIVITIAFILFLFVEYTIENRLDEVHTKVETIEKVLKSVYGSSDYDFKKLGYEVVFSDNNKIVYRNKYKESFIVISIVDKKAIKVYDITCPSVQIEFTKQEKAVVKKKIEELNKRYTPKDLEL